MYGDRNTWVQIPTQPFNWQVYVPKPRAEFAANTNLFDLNFPTINLLKIVVTKKKNKNESVFASPTSPEKQQRDFTKTVPKNVSASYRMWLLQM